MERALRPGMLLLALALLVGTVAAFTYTEVLKLERKPVGDIRFDRWLSPVCDCPTAAARLRFELREPGRITVTVVDDEGDAVRVLTQDAGHPAGTVTLSWDGRDEAGQAVPDGVYHVRVRLLDERRTIAIPVGVNVDTQAPRVNLLSVEPRSLAAGEALELRYRASETGRAVLSVDGEEVLRGKLRRAGAPGLAWPGLVDGAPLAAGLHAVALALEDRAGNVSAPTEPVTIVVTPAL